jgi:hypothetical protein
MRKILFVLAVFAFAVSVPVYAADNVSGTWVLTQMSPMGGEDIWDVVITQDGENLNVTATPSHTQVMFSGAGILKESKIKFSLKNPDNQLEFIFEGKVTGKKMEGTREIRQDVSGGTMIFEPPPSDGGSKPTDDERESFNTWSAVMK